MLAVVEKDKDAPPAIVEYMCAMLSFKEGKWLQASRDFERLKPAFPDRVSQINMMLWHCYELLGETTSASWKPTNVQWAITRRVCQRMWAWPWR